MYMIFFSLPSTLALGSPATPKPRHHCPPARLVPPAPAHWRSYVLSPDLEPTSPRGDGAGLPAALCSGSGRPDCRLAVAVAVELAGPGDSDELGLHEHIMSFRQPA